MKTQAFLDSMISEAQRARAKFRKFNSTHEAYAVILEELEEYWELVKKDEPTSSVNYEMELVQIAAMCLCASRELHTKEMHG